MPCRAEASLLRVGACRVSVGTCWYQACCAVLINVRMRVACRVGPSLIFTKHVLYIYYCKVVCQQNGRVVYVCIYIYVSIIISIIIYIYILL